MVKRSTALRPWLRLFRLSERETPHRKPFLVDHSSPGAHLGLSGAWVKKILLLGGSIVVLLIGVLIWYSTYETTTYTLQPMTVRAGEKMTVNFEHFGQQDDPVCLYEGGVEDVRNSSQQSSFIEIQDIQGKENPLVGKTGFINSGVHEQILNGETYLIKNVGRCLPAANPTTFMERLQKATKIGVTQQLTILPGTEAGQYTVFVGGQELALTVTQ